MSAAYVLSNFDDARDQVVNILKKNVGAVNLVIAKLGTYADGNFFPSTLLA